MNKPNVGHDGSEPKQSEAALERRFKGMLERLESLQKDLHELRESHAKIGLGQSWLDEQQTLIKERYLQLEDRQRMLEERQVRVEARQARLDERQAQLEAPPEKEPAAVPAQGQPLPDGPDPNKNFNYLLESYVPFKEEPIAVVVNAGQR